jgi:hypothetical protein
MAASPPDTVLELQGNTLMYPRTKPRQAAVLCAQVPQPPRSGPSFNSVVQA